MSRLAAEAFAPSGLSPSHAFVLLSVAATPGIHPTQIARQMELERSTVTRFLDSLERRGLVRRQTQGRQAVVDLTAAGENLVPQVRLQWQALYAHYTALLGENPAKALTSAVYDAYATFESNAGAIPAGRSR